MSKTISTGKQLEMLLSKIVSEGVKTAKDELEKLNENALPRLLEQEDEEGDDEEVESKDEDPADAPAKDIEVSKEDEAEADVDVDVDEEEKDPMKRGPRKAPERPETGSDVKLRNILYDINQIRSGRSLKDPDVKSNLEDYFNKLSNPERMALSEFLEGLTDVIVMGIPAEQAEDPSDEIVMKEPDAPSDTKEVEVEAEEEVEEKAVEKPAEDLTPPIQVRR
jgi:hypothetical protein